ncbi:MAG: xanthine dehydrogenase family protein molybdopterin-binding subunit [Actinomycetota bacterium]
MSGSADRTDSAESVDGPFVGRALPAVDRALLDGTARFAADTVPVAGALELALVRTAHAHANIDGVDGATALDKPGVEAVVSGVTLAEHCRPLGNILTTGAPFHPLAVDRIRYWGEPVAAVVADTRALAEDGADAVVVDATPLPIVVDPGEAAERGAPVLHPALDTNVVHDRSFTYGDPDDAFATAAHVVRYEATFPRSSAFPLEPFVACAEYDPDLDRTTLWANYGGPLALHTVVAGALGVGLDRIRLIVPERIGGNFGLKQALYPSLVLVAVLARLVGRPVRWVEDRNEHLVASSAGSQRVTSIDGAFDDDGRLLALRVDQLENTGAYVRTPEPAGLYRMHGTLNGPYDVSNLSVRNRVVLTNQVPSGLNRGFGAPAFFHALESMFDAAAVQLDIDRAELRRRNLVTTFPYSCPSGSTLDSGDYRAVLDRALDLAGYPEAIARAARARADGRPVGVGLGCSVESAGNNLGYMNLAGDPDLPATRSPKSGAGAIATVSVDPFGAVSVQLDSPDCGQGYRTVAAQVVADELGLDPATVRVRTALDTATDGWTLTSGNYANRFSTAVASASARAARKAAAKLRSLAGAEFGVDGDRLELIGGRVVDPGSSRSLPLGRLAGQLHWDLANNAEGVGGPIRETGVYAPPDLGPPDELGRISTSFTFSFQCDLAIVEVDPTTGELQVERYITVHDAGTVLNPGLFDGQVRGGLAHGFGAAIREEVAYRSDGVPTALDLRAYGPVLATDLPPVVIDHLVTPSPNTETGAKGLGDGCAILAPTVLASALADAFCLPTAPVPPFTPARVWLLASEAEGMAVR